MYTHRIDTTAIKLEELVKLYHLTGGSKKEDETIDHDAALKHWLYSADTTTILNDKNEDTSSIQICTDGNKTEQGVGEVIAIYRSGIHTKSLKYRLNNRCTKNQAEQVAILKSLEYIESIQTDDKTATIHTDSRTKLDSLKNNIHTSLRRDKTESDGDGNNRLENQILLGQKTHWDPRKRARRHTRKGGSGEHGHHKMVPQSFRKCREKVN